jgi:glycosyltransferase involved in cell wall biosynthesis
LRPCVLIPIFDHGDTIGEVVDSLADLGLPCFIVDDGSGPATRSQVDRLETRYDWVVVEHLPRNQGRGVALRRGWALAASHGMTHAVQVDADCQHDTRDIPRFLEAAAKDPEALILGDPIFDDSAPWIRVQGRKLSQWCVWLETASFGIHDPLCGFRCFPIERTLRVLERVSVGDRMDFDPEIAVHLVWDGAAVINVPTRVTYREGGISHFDFISDNYLMVRAHTQLILGAAARAIGAGRLLSDAGRRSEDR